MRRSVIRNDITRRGDKALRGSRRRIRGRNCKEGLLEIMGTLVRPEDRDSVAGWLTAEDVIKRIESR